jgi:hypothetical protein
MAFPTPNSPVPVGVAIGVALTVALDNILLGVWRCVWMVGLDSFQVERSGDGVGEGNYLHLRRDQLCHHRKTILTAPRSGAAADRVRPLTIAARARITAQIASTAYKCSFFIRSLHSSLAPSIT